MYFFFLYDSYIINMSICIKKKKEYKYINYLIIWLKFTGLSLIKFHFMEFLFIFPMIYEWLGQFLSQNFFKCTFNGIYISIL